MESGGYGFGFAIVLVLFILLAIVDAHATQTGDIN